MTKKNTTKTPVRRGSADVERVRVNVEKWTATVWNAGWTGVPNALLDTQGRLGISPAALAVLLQLLKRWWKKADLPFPSHQEVMNATGMKQRSVQRAFNELVRGGLVKKRRRRINGGWTSNEYSFEPLIDQLKPIAKEILDARQESDAYRVRREAEVGRRRGRKSAAAAAEAPVLVGPVSRRKRVRQEGGGQ